MTLCLCGRPPSPGGGDMVILRDREWLFRGWGMRDRYFRYDVGWKKGRSYGRQTNRLSASLKFSRRG